MPTEFSGQAAIRATVFINIRHNFEPQRTSSRRSKPCIILYHQRSCTGALPSSSSQQKTKMAPPTSPQCHPHGGWPTAACSAYLPALRRLETYSARDLASSTCPPTIWRITSTPSLAQPVRILSHNGKLVQDIGMLRTSGLVRT